MVLALFLSIVSVTAGPVQFSGTVGIYAEQNWIQQISGDSLRKPYSETRFTLNPKLTISGLPLSFDMLLSSQENRLRQMLDQFKIYLRPEELLKQKFSIPSMPSLPSVPSAPSPLSFLSFIKGAELGTCNPSYSPLTVSGVSITGGSVEFNPWYIYLATAVGRSQRAIEGSDTTQPAYSRMFYSGRFGFGKKEKTHLFFTGLKVRDDPNSISRNYIIRYIILPGDSLNPPDSLVDSLETVVPKENYVLGVEFNLSLFKDHFRVESEITGSELTRDNRAQAYHIDINIDSVDNKWVKRIAQKLHINGVPEWAESIIHPRWTSGFDYAYSVKPSFNIFGTQIYGSAKMVGPGYQTLGNPTLRKDNLAYGGGIKRSFINNRISFSGSYSQEHDNLLNMKQYTTSFISYSANLGINFPNAPYFQLSYNPYTQQNTNMKEHADIASFNTGYNFNIGNVSNSPNLSVSFQKRKTLLPSDDYTMFDINLSHNIDFQFPLSVSVSGDLNQSTCPAEISRIISFAVSPSYTVFASWNNSLTLNASFENGIKRYDTRLNSSFPVWKIADASVGVERNYYRGSDGSYNEFRLISELNRSW